MADLFFTVDVKSYVSNNPVMRVDPSGYGWISNAWNKVKSVTKKVVKAVGNGIKKAARAVSNGVKRVVARVKKTKVYKTAKRAVTESKKFVEDVYSAGKKSLTEKVERIAKTGEQIGSGLKRAVNATVGFVKMAADETIGFVGKVCDEFKDENSTLNRVLDGVQAGLGVVGMIPGVGEIADGISAVISLARGDVAGALLDLTSMIPFVGNATGALKIGTKLAGAAGAFKAADKILDVVAPVGKVLDDIVSPVKKLGGEALAAVGSLFAKNGDNIVREATEEIGEKVAKNIDDLPGRKGAFNQAKRDAGIPRGQQPQKVEYVEMRTAPYEGSHVIKDADGNIIKTREYYYTNTKGDSIVIQDHSAGHLKGGQESHFNVRPAGDTRNGNVIGAKDHYPFK